MTFCHRTDPHPAHTYSLPIFGTHDCPGRTKTACGAHVYWWDGEYEGDCELDEGHDGPHFDGVSWYDDEGDEVQPPGGLTEEEA